ncbi:MAG: CHRD domain-containing protein [Acidobacteria bacterium]|nr:CHRD domain-containing protein [Acidobacteriota bacterium]
MVSERFSARAGWIAACVAVLVPVFGTNVAGQGSTNFVARLSTVPIMVANQDTVSGQGAASATLNGNRLTVSGKFEGLRSSATVARIHLAPRGTRGQAIADLVVSKGTSGTLEGTVELTSPQVQALNKSSLYIQIHSEKAPEGNLWGWLFPREAK